MRIDPAGLPFVVGALAAALLAGIALGWPFAIPLVVLAAFFLFFFRDPERQVVAADDVVLSPADGRVLVAGPAERGSRAAGRVAADQHLPLADGRAREPRAGVGARHARQLSAGRFLPAYHRDAAATNERSEIWIDHRAGRSSSRQIVGMLARRVVCRAQLGAEVRAGDRYGVMKFGSRMDVFLPTDAELRVKVGRRVRGGETVIAVLH